MRASDKDRYRAAVRPQRSSDAVQAAAEYGIGIAQLRDNLALSVSERLGRHQIALDTVELVQKANRL